MQETGRKRGKRKWEYTMLDIERVSGVPMRTLKAHRQTGLLKPGDLMSISWYVVANRAKALAALGDDDETAEDIQRKLPDDSSRGEPEAGANAQGA